MIRRDMRPPASFPAFIAMDSLPVMMSGAFQLSMTLSSLFLPCTTTVSPALQPTGHSLIWYSHRCAGMVAEHALLSFLWTLCCTRTTMWPLCTQQPSQQGFIPVHVCTLHTRKTDGFVLANDVLADGFDREFMTKFDSLSRKAMMHAPTAG